MEQVQYVNGFMDLKSQIWCCLGGKKNIKKYFMTSEEIFIQLDENFPVSWTLMQGK